MPPRPRASAAFTKAKRARVGERGRQPASDLSRSTMTFLTLPIEIRIRIYEISFANVTLRLDTMPPSDPQKRWAWHDKPQLELSSKQIRRECLHVRRRMTTLTTCFLAVYKPLPHQQVPELPTALRALPRPVASTLTHLSMTRLSMTIGSFRYLREFDVDWLSSLKMISFDMVLYVRLNLSKEDVNDSAKLLSCTLRRVGAVGGQEWLPRGLPKTGVRYDGHVRVLDDRKVLAEFVVDLNRLKLVWWQGFLRDSAGEILEYGELEIPEELKAK